MKHIATAFAAAAMMAVSIPLTAGVASAQSVNQRERNLSYRINIGVRNGSLTRPEASRLRTRLANLNRLEWRYRHNGLSYRERRDLDRRFDALSRAIRTQRHDRQKRWRRR
jgi:hypothetical protein